MATNDISLTSGMRNNLVSLQQTVSLLDRTQTRLSTGKKVNSALDNPINYFASQNHLSRASDIAGYKDNMSEAIQTIQAANAGIKQIQALIENARGLAQAALSAAGNSVSFTIDEAVASGDTIDIGGTTFSAVNTGATGTEQFNVQDSEGNDLTIDQIVSNLAAKINQNKENDPGVGVGNLKAVVSGNRITLTSIGSDDAITSTDVVEDTAFNTVDDKVTAERSNYAAQYEEIMNQIDSLAGTSGYKGNNLLTNDTLAVSFEGGSLSVQGFNANVSDMGVNTIGEAFSDDRAGAGEENVKWALTSYIKHDINNLDKGIAKLKEQSAKLSSSLSVINIQQDFSTDKINILTKGADNLTAADSNEEGANMLMLQTRQSLSTTALSLSAQAAQSVLRLFS
jgi:flagellin-like hook-associated protein FlgL